MPKRTSINAQTNVPSAESRDVPGDHNVYQGNQNPSKSRALLSDMKPRKQIYQLQSYSGQEETVQGIREAPTHSVCRANEPMGIRKIHQLAIHPNGFGQVQWVPVELPSWGGGVQIRELEQLHNRVGV